MNRTIFSLIILVSAVLSACVGTSKSNSSTVVYDFGLPAARLLPEGAGPKLMLEVKSPGWFDSLNIDYRLAYEDSLKQREYAASRWAANPGVLLGQSLRQQLGMTNALAADCVLKVELQEFSQVFDTPQLSHGLLLASVSLVSTKRQLIAERQISLRHTAASADASGGVRALVAASGELGQQLADWLLALDKQGELVSCRPAKT
jgi:cholesterol transport system auxiliary component